MSTEKNVELWKKFYDDIPRQRNCDLTFLTLLYRYTPIRLKSKISNALVIGAGDGAEAFEVARNNVSTTALDISEHAINRLRLFCEDESTSLNLICDDQRNLDKLNVVYDLIISWSTLSYLTMPEINSALLQIEKLLSNGGSFIVLFEGTESSICDPKFSDRSEFNSYIIKNNSLINPGLTMTCFDKEQLSSMLEDLFEVIAYSYRNLHIPPRGDFVVSQHMYVLRKR